jgi:outer membrane protein assembly factor BamB
MQRQALSSVVLAMLTVLLGSNTLHGQDWPQWRGTNRDARVGTFTAPATWPKELKQKWKITVGRGDATPALVGDKVYVFARQGDEEVTTGVEAATGKVLWEDKYVAERVVGAAIGMWGSQGGPRSSPAVAEGKICTYGIGGVLSCLDAATGKVVWRKDSKGRPQFYTASSPMIVEGKCIAFGGNKGALTAYNLGDGAPIWEWTGTSEPYGSPVLMTVDGIRQIVTPTMMNTIAGVRLSDGKLLWQVKLGGTGYTNSLGTPIVDGQTIIYCAPLKTKGALAVKIERNGEKFSATELWRNELTVATFSTPVLRDGLLFGVSGSYFCMDAKTGNLLWLDKTQRVNSGAVVDAGSVLLGLNINRDLVVFKADQKEYMELARYRVAESATWAYPVVSGNRVFVKDTDTLTLWTIE